MLAGFRMVAKRYRMRGFSDAYSSVCALKSLDTNEVGRLQLGCDGVELEISRQPENEFATPDTQDMHTCAVADH